MYSVHSPFFFFVVAPIETNRVFGAIWPDNVLTFRGLRKSGLDGTKGHSCEQDEIGHRTGSWGGSNLRTVGSYTILRSPFLGNCFGQPYQARLGQSVAGLSSVTIDPRGGRDVDDGPLLAIFDHEKRCCCPDQLEGCRVVQCHYGFFLCMSAGVP